MTIIRLAYASQLLPFVTDLELDRIVATSARHNCQNGITGCLSIDGRQVVQILEGPDQKIQALMERITRDPRHQGVVEFHRVEIERLTFRDWGMRRWSLIDVAAALVA